MLHFYLVYLFIFLTLAKFTIRACKAYAIMREYNVLIFRIDFFLHLKHLFEKVYSEYLFRRVKFYLKNEQIYSLSLTAIFCYKNSFYP